MPTFQTVLEVGGLFLNHRIQKADKLELGTRQVGSGTHPVYYFNEVPTKVKYFSQFRFAVRDESRRFEECLEVTSVNSST